jgi:hypothetical protein
LNCKISVRARTVFLGNFWVITLCSDGRRSFIDAGANCDESSPGAKLGRVGIALNCAALQDLSDSAFLNLSQLPVHVIGLLAIALPSISECHPDAERHESKRWN